jgi:four helix bundle protein
MRNFQKLEVWKKSHRFTLAIYRLTANFPSGERYGLTSQLQRASASIGANLAEGCGRETGADYKRFVQMAAGSACEVEFHLILAKDLSLIDKQTYEALNNDINEIKRMLCGLTHYLENEIQVSHQPR